MVSEMTKMSHSDLANSETQVSTLSTLFSGSD